jgi:hypothetical protein
MPEAKKGLGLSQMYPALPSISSQKTSLAHASGDSIPDFPDKDEEKQRGLRALAGVPDMGYGEAVNLRKPPFHV